MDLGLRGKVVLVTGGAGRIGPVICETFAREGAALGIVDIDTRRAEAIATALHDAGRQAVAVGAGVSRKDEVQRALENVTAAFGPVNTRGTMLTCQAVGNQMKTRRTGEPADIAEVVAFVASDRAAWMTGSIVQVSGGSHTGRPHVPLPRPPA
ncbi:MAG: SDR family oxidoreductase [Chloroflexota bacterium]|nr:SDR family oxidoreductase [Chloroflexota bacterium]